MEKYIIYTDGSSRGNPGRGGWAAIVIENNYGGQGPLVKEIGGRDEMTTNNKMEMTAAIEALKSLLPDVEAIVHTDSEYLMKGITIWIKNWQKNNWRTKAKGEVLNKELWLTLLEETGKRNVSWEKVEGHSGHIFNDRCDLIATSFADGEEIKLFNGKKEDYPLFH